MSLNTPSESECEYLQEDLPAFKNDMSGEKDDRRQEVVFIGQKIKKDELVAALDDCLLRPDETVSLATLYRAFHNHHRKKALFNFMMHT